MARTPDEIKKGLEVCNIGMVDEPNHCMECPYFCTKDCADTLMKHVLALIQQLEAERDAAVRDCGCFPCQTCEERENGDLCPMCEINGGYRKFHQWRGAQKEEPPLGGNSDDFVHGNHG